MIFLAFLDFVYAFSLCRPATPATSLVVFLQSIAPLGVFAGAWLVVGVLCLAGAFGRRRWPWLDIWPFLAAVMIKVFWSTLIILGWLIGEVDRGWAAASVWIAVGVLVVTLAGWQEPTEE